MGNVETMSRIGQLALIPDERQLARSSRSWYVAGQPFSYRIHHLPFSWWRLKQSFTEQAILAPRLN